MKNPRIIDRHTRLQTGNLIRQWKEKQELNKVYFKE